MTKRGSLLMLKSMCEERGLLFTGITRVWREDGFQVFVHNPKKAGIEPILENSRDEQDYDLAYRSWISRGMEVIGQDENPNEAIRLAIEYLEQQ